jgi:ketosteroid isomerase-like protein
VTEDPAANAALIERFYTAFGRRDHAEMGGCYAPDARFSDPAFGELRGEQVGGMWRMLTSRATDLDVDLAEHDADETTGSAHWIARYTFARTGHPVTNDIRAGFRFENGLIVEHDDSFSFHAWSRQALGPPGLLLGWTPLLRNKVRGQARAELEKFLAEGPQSEDARAS